MFRTKLLLNRIMAVLLVIFMLLPSMSVFAVSGSTVSVGSASGQPGDQVSVTVSVSGNPGIAYLKLRIGYDASQLTLTGATNSGVLSGTFTTSKTTDTNPYVLQWMGAENAAGNGVVATLTFQIASNASAGDKAISVSVDECYNETFDDVTLSSSNGIIIVEDNADTTKPTGSISSTNNVATSQTVTLNLSDNEGVAGYYWGTSSSYINNTYTSTSASSVTQTVSSAGTYYLVVKDTSGNVSTSHSITFYKTTLEANGGSVSPSYVITKDGNTLTLPTPTNSNLTFVGWGTSSTATSGVKSITVSSSKTYYAVWESTNIVSGKCGDNVYYKVNLDTMVLSIYGYGTMRSYEHSETPWEKYCENICRIVIENGVTSIGTSSFAGFSNLTDIEIAKSVVEINSMAFSNCTSLTNFVIPEGVKRLGQYVFNDCEKLQSIYVPSSVSYISEDAFGDLIDLKEIIVSENNSTYYSVEGVLYGNGKLYKYPSSSEVTSFTIPNGIHTICWRAFSYSRNLTTINLNSVTTIKSTAFEGCTQIESINASNCNIVGGYAFSGCSGLKQVKLSVDLTSVELYTFSGCTNLEKIEIPDNVTSVGYAAFYGCNSLTDLSLPEKLTHVGDMAFRCSNLRNVTVLSKNIEFGENVFGYTNDGHFIGSNDLTLISYSGSNTEQYADENGIPFIALDKIEITSISVCSNPAKTTYYIGDSLSISGLKLLATYDDGSTETITSGFTTSGFSSTSAGTKIVTVSYDGKTTTFTVTVNTPSILLSSTSKSMTVGDTATLTATTTPSGQTVTWTSGNTSVATVSGGTITAKAAGTATITAKFTYNGVTYSKTCSVIVAPASNPEPTISSISIATKPTKTTYEIGEPLNTSGLTLKLSYSDGSTKTVSSGFTTSGFSSTTAGTKTVTVSCDGKTTSFTVTVNEAPVPENSAQLIMSSSDTMAGKEVVVTLSVKNNPGIAGLAISLKYDENVLTLKETKNGGLFSGFTAAKNFAWDESNDVVEDGILATYTFTVAEDAQAGDYSIEVLIRSCTNENLDDVELLTTNGRISIIDFVYGDSNGDQKIDMKDVVLLRKYITNFDYDTNTSSVNVELGADANGDNKIDMKDVVILRKYITNYDYDTESSTVVLGPQ